MLISPAEPAIFKSLGTSSSIPEKYGADFYMFSPVLGRVGVQRKEIKDLIASLHDDRLSREIPQLQTLEVGVLLIEGRLEWSNEDTLLSVSRSEFTKAQFLGLCWTVQSSGLWLSFTTSQTETINYLSSFSRWMTKTRHTSLLRRSKNGSKNAYGTRESRDWQIHVMQGFPGVGYERAANIVDYFGTLPLAWTGNLSEVPGIGKTTSKKLEGLLRSNEGADHVETDH